MLIQTTTHCYKCGRGSEEGVGWKLETTRTGKQVLHETCPEKVCIARVNGGPENRWDHFRICSRTAVELIEEKWLCGIHRGAYRRRKKNDNIYQAKSDASTNNRNRAISATDILADLNVHSDAHHDPINKKFTGKIVLDPKELFDVMGINVTLPEIE